MITQRLSGVSLQQIQVFLSVGETCHFTQSAQLLNMTQSGISKSLAKLEQLLEVPLFERTKRSVVLTPEGKILYDTWKKGYQFLEEGLLTATSTEDSLRLGATITINPGKVLPPYTQGFMGRYPNYNISVLEEKAMALREQLRSGALDIIFIPEAQIYNLNPDNFNWTYVAHSNLQIILCTSHPLAKQSHVTMEEVLSVPQLVIDPMVNDNFITHLKTYAQTYEVPLRIGGYVHSTYDVQHQLAKSNHVFLCEEYYSIVLPENYIKIPVINQRSSVLCVWKKHGLRNSVRQFLALVEENNDFG